MIYTAYTTENKGITCDLELGDKNPPDCVRPFCPEFLLSGSKGGPKGEQGFLHPEPLGGQGCIFLNDDNVIYSKKGMIVGLLQKHENKNLNQSFLLAAISSHLGKKFEGIEQLIKDIMDEKSSSIIISCLEIAIAYDKVLLN